MYKKITALACVLLLLCGCSQESKFGIEQFVTRMNNQFETTYQTADFMIGTNENNENYMFCDNSDGLIVLSLDSNNDIKGISLLINESIDINEGINTFCKLCCVFTGNNEEEQRSTLSNCMINSDTIKYADSNMIITVGKYRYTVVCNEYSVTLFCDRA